MNRDRDPTAANARKAARNREILRQRQSGMTYAALAKLHGLVDARIKRIVDLETLRVAREAELALADTLPEQPNPLHLSPKTRAKAAEAVGRDKFTRDDVRAIGMITILRMSGFTWSHRRELQAWLDRP